MKREMSDIAYAFLFFFFFIVVHEKKTWSSMEDTRFRGKVYMLLLFCCINFLRKVLNTDQEGKKSVKNCIVSLSSNHMCINLCSAKYIKQNMKKVGVLCMFTKHVVFSPSITWRQNPPQLNLV